MAIYKNDYEKKEDFVLWEIHEIRHKLSKKLKKMTISEINNQTKELLNSWKMQII